MGVSLSHLDDLLIFFMPVMARVVSGGEFQVLIAK